MLKARNITKWFGEGEAKTYALHDVSFDVDYGEMLYIVGPSGSGKTTLLSIISGILRPNAGSVTVMDKNLWELSDNDLADFRLYTLGFVFQDFHLFKKLTCKENVAIPLILQQKSMDVALAAALKELKIVGLEKRTELNPNRLSIGEQQRVAIARAIVTQPTLLILDEPTASLDGETGKRIISFIKDNLLNENRAIIVV
ncbi:MAG TPA: ABC transporter ATP-binding protein, partial [Gammaproteobacteria bacterium]|nr:ABC transporter ATP-binding protein [Gammaproteobacteria bacterium]